MLERINKYSNNIFRLSLLLIIILISSDIFLVIDISQATIRFSYILFSTVFILWIIYFIFSKNYNIPADISFMPLILFCFISFISSMLSEFPLKSLVYSLWTVFNALTILFLLWFSRSGKTKNLDWLLKVYFYSFFVITVLGIYQFLLPFLIGDKTPFVMQWWQEYRLARVNGLSFEPSYFATYLLMGFASWFILWLRKSEIVAYRGIILIAIGLIIFLSSSRLGWLGVALIIVYGLIEFFGDSLINRKFKKQNLKLFIAFIIIVLIAIIGVLLIMNNRQTYKFIFRGTGLFNTPDYSVALRNTRTIETFMVFLDNPLNFFLGVGPGGVGAYLVSNTEKFTVISDSFEKLWAIEPNNLTAELLASVGIIGFVFFAWFIISICKRLWDLYKNCNLMNKYRTVCLALFCSLILEIIILQFNQNYLRPYLWLHIGICISTAHTLEHLLKNFKSSVFVTNDKK